LFGTILIWLKTVYSRRKPPTCCKSQTNFITKCYIEYRHERGLNHPIKWERHGRDGSKEVISILANVESVLDTEYHVKLITSANNNDDMSFSLTFPQGLWVHFVYLINNWKIYWSEQSFVGLGPEDQGSSWGLKWRFLCVYMYYKPWGNVNEFCISETKQKYGYFIIYFLIY
jgi:hypothetical protein